jgi:hypothetical protein
MRQGVGEMDYEPNGVNQILSLCHFFISTLYPESGGGRKWIPYARIASVSAPGLRNGLDEGHLRQLFSNQFNFPRQAFEFRMSVGFNKNSFTKGN